MPTTVKLPICVPFFGHVQVGLKRWQVLGAEILILRTVGLQLENP